MTAECCTLLFSTIEDGGGFEMGITSIEVEEDPFAYRYDTQLLIDKRDEDLDEDAIGARRQGREDGDALS